MPPPSGHGARPRPPRVDPARRHAAGARTARERQSHGGGRRRCSQMPRASVPATSTSAVADANAAADAAPNGPPTSARAATGVHNEGSDRGLPDPASMSPDLPPPARTRRAPATQPVSHHRDCYHGDNPGGEGGERAHGKEAPPPSSSPLGGPPPASTDGVEGREMNYLLATNSYHARAGTCLFPSSGYFVIHGCFYKNGRRG